MKKSSLILALTSVLCHPLLTLHAATVSITVEDNHHGHGHAHHLHAAASPVVPPGEYSWRDYQGYISPEMIAGGHEPGRTLYICQASYMGGMHPGKVVDGVCNITYGGHEVGMHHFRILTGSGLRWRHIEFGRLPHRAIEGGFENGQPLYVCQAEYAGGMHPGKVVAGGCNIGYGGNEISLNNYNVLVVNTGVRYPQYIHQVQRTVYKSNFDL